MCFSILGSYERSFPEEIRYQEKSKNKVTAAEILMKSRRLIKFSTLQPGKLNLKEFDNITNAVGRINLSKSTVVPPKMADIEKSDYSSPSSAQFDPAKVIFQNNWICRWWRRIATRDN